MDYDAEHNSLLGSALLSTHKLVLVQVHFNHTATLENEDQLVLMHSESRKRERCLVCVVKL